MSKPIDKSAYLGGPNDPAPVWRCEADDAKNWPDGAMFAVMFRKEDFPVGVSAYILAELPRTEFYGADGWPLELPSDRKGLSDAIRKDFQVFPRQWRLWSARTWVRAREFPEMFERGRASSRIASRVAELTSPLVHFAD